MKNILIRFSAVMLVLVMCLGVFASCDDAKKDDATTTDAAQTTEVTTAGEGATSTKKVTFEDLCEGMTEEEIQQVLKDLEDLNMTPDDLVNMLYE